MKSAQQVRSGSWQLAYGIRRWCFDGPRGEYPGNPVIVSQKISVDDQLVETSVEQLVGQWCAEGFR